eukprot:jgi/Galph1/4120/GphlegSOOS_G2756.1
MLFTRLMGSPQQILLTSRIGVNALFAAGKCQLNIFKCFGNKPESGTTIPHKKRPSIPADGLTLEHFIAKSYPQVVQVGSATGDLKPVKAVVKYGSRGHIGDINNIPYEKLGVDQKVYLETFGCQMNVSDSEIIRSLLEDAGFSFVSSEKEATIVLLNTCAIREKAERKIWHRLIDLKQSYANECGTNPYRVVGVLGCMAERLKEKLLDGDKRLVNIVAGPDSYRDLPYLLAAVSLGENDAAAFNVQLSMEETYADISPVNVDHQGISAFVSVMRGCDNFCSFCVVPYTRGRERSRPMETVISHVKRLSDNGYKEVVLLGQNVNSYNDTATLQTDTIMTYSPGFRTVYKPKKKGISFAELLRRVCEVNPDMRYPNLCRQIHLPAQSGSSNVLKKMRRGYTRETYLSLVQQIKQHVRGVSLSSDFIAGFCGETEEDHRETLDLIKEVKYKQAFTFAYSKRSNTFASKHLVDDVPAEVKSRRLQELIKTFRQVSEEQSCLSEVNTCKLVLVNGKEKASDGKEYWTGRSEDNKKCFIPVRHIYSSIQDLNSNNASSLVPIQVGDYVMVSVTDPGIQRLYTIPLARTTISEFRRLEEQEGNKVMFASS